MYSRAVGRFDNLRGGGSNRRPFKGTCPFSAGSSKFTGAYTTRDTL
jgi:hypothetical protein